jgi:predicted HTH domain antitoxin
MYEIVLTIPEETAEALNSSPTVIGDEVKLAAAVKLFEIGRLSSGAAAVLAGIPRTMFLDKLGEYGVNTFDLTEAELLEDIKNA